ncbi:hypothetical protein BGZ72_000833 [Mortierella alpina]|nr:hypothetical protein BGZ72_000833 [Mortierella alpina]
MDPWERRGGRDDRGGGDRGAPSGDSGALAPMEFQTALDDSRVNSKVPAHGGGNVEDQTFKDLLDGVKAVLPEMTSYRLRLILAGSSFAAVRLLYDDDARKSAGGAALRAVDEVTELKRQNEEMANVIAEWRSEAQYLTNENQALTSQVTELTDENQALTGQITTLTGEVTDLTNRVTELTIENLALTGQVTNLTGEVAELTNQVAELTGMVAQVNQNNAALMGQLANILAHLQGANPSAT